MSSLVYLYGFVPSGSALPAAGLAGIADTVVELLPQDGFDAVVSRVASADFEPGALDEHTRDLAWVGAHGVAHEAVVAWFVDHGQILPVPVLTLFSAQEALAAYVTGRAGWISAMLRQFAGLREWDLKVTCTEAELAAHAGELSPDVADLDTRIAQASPGTRFLLERKRTELVHDEVRRLATRIGDGLAQQAADIAERVKRLPLARTDEATTVVLNAAVLVRSEREPELRSALSAAAAGLDSLGVTIQLSGPWAPYRFVAEEEPVV
ncbi:MAG TPA: GvpL/GvpF family gas vesicle protein [Longimicrobiales bacterium]